MFRKIAISAVSALTLFTGAALAETEANTTDVAFSFEGPFGTFDTHQLQRGLQLFTEVCSACHGLKFLRIGALADVGGPQLPEDQVKAYAKAITVSDAETGEDRPATPADHFPANTGAGAPDLSVMAKARKGFSGPYGLTTNQLFKGMGGPEHIYSVLTGYKDNPTCAPDGIDGFYYNTGFANGAVPDTCKVNGVSTIEGSWIAMPPPLTAGVVTYADGTETSIENEAKDVAAFLMWAAEPKMMARKESGFKAVLLLGLLSVMLYLTNKRIWANVKGKKHA
ncbi:MAG: cytochrome c1 [Pseudorhodobacter sp.]|nr:cytochrome c1 [Pseudorhodobacter sp.]